MGYNCEKCCSNAGEESEFIDESLMQRAENMKGISKSGESNPLTRNQMRKGGLIISNEFKSTYNGALTSKGMQV
jgi:hypothetical protein